MKMEPLAHAVSKLKGFQHSVYIVRTRQICTAQTASVPLFVDFRILLWPYLRLYYHRLEFLTGGGLGLFNCQCAFLL